MMDQVQFALGKLAEECLEVAKECHKIQQYGFDGHHPDDPNTSNKQRLMNELHDVQGALIFLERMTQGKFEFVSNTRLELEKLDKITEQMNISISRGMVEREDEEEDPDE